MFKLFIVENVFSNDRRVLSNIAWRLNMMEIKANTWSLGLWKKIKMKNKKKNGIWSWKLNRVPAGTLSPLSNWLQLIGEVPWYNEYTMARASETESGQKFWNFHLSALFIFFSSILFYFIFPLPSISSFFSKYCFLIHFLFYFTVVFIVSCCFWFESWSCLGRRNYWYYFARSLPSSGDVGDERRRFSLLESRNEGLSCEVEFYIIYVILVMDIEKVLWSLVYFLLIY